MILIYKLDKIVALQMKSNMLNETQIKGHVNKYLVHGSAILAHDTC